MTSREGIRMRETIQAKLVAGATDRGGTSGDAIKLQPCRKAYRPGHGCLTVRIFTSRADPDRYNLR